MSVLTAPRLTSRPVRTLVLVVVLATVMTLVGAVIGGLGPRSALDPSPVGAAVSAPTVVDAADVNKAVSSLQERLRALPDDWNAWANLGMLYTTQARLTADPSYYAKADGALASSLRVRADDNGAATTGQAALAASRHDFAGALALTQAVDHANP